MGGRDIKNWKSTCLVVAEIYSCSPLSLLWNKRNTESLGCWKYQNFT